MMLERNVCPCVCVCVCVCVCGTSKIIQAGHRLGHRKTAMALSVIEKRIKDSVYEINALRANIQAEQDKLDMIHNVNLKRTSELTETMNEKNKEKSEARKLQLINTRMQEDNKAMVQRMEGIKNRITDISKDRDEIGRAHV